MSKDRKVPPQQDNKARNHKRAKLPTKGQLANAERFARGGKPKVLSGASSAAEPDFLGRQLR